MSHPTPRSSQGVEATTRWQERNAIVKSPKIQAEFIEPMQCLLVSKLPEGKDWEYELKLDGYRTLAVKHGGPAKRQEDSNFSWLVLPLEFPVSRDGDKGEFLDANAQEI